jgi:hypothetical protein
LVSTILVFIFAGACLATFAFGFREEWKKARVISASVAVLAFLLALASTVK